MHTLSTGLLWLLGAVFLWVLEKILARLLDNPVDRFFDRIRDWWISGNLRLLEEELQRLTRDIERNRRWQFTPAQEALYEMALLAVLHIDVMGMLMIVLIGALDLRLDPHMVNSWRAMPPTLWILWAVLVVGGLFVALILWAAMRRVIAFDVHVRAAQERLEQRVKRLKMKAEALREKSRARNDKQR
jgi:hypothetical protein